MKVFNTDSDIYRLLEKLTNFLLLNVLWIIMCISIITIFPATAAMFAVVRQWIRKEDSGVFRNFFIYFKENFYQSFPLGIIWLLIAFLFYFNINISLQMAGPIKVIMISLLSFLLLFFVMTSIFLFPIMVHYKMRWKTLIKNSFLFSISQFWVTIRCIFILFLTIFISFTIPITSFILWGVATFYIYALCDKSFTKIESMVQTSIGKDEQEAIS